MLSFIGTIPPSLCYLLYVNVNNIIKPFPQLPSHLGVVIDLLLEKVLVLLTYLRQYLRRTCPEETLFHHTLLNQPFFQLHQVIYLQILKTLILQLTFSLVPHLLVISLNHITRTPSLPEYLKTVLPIVLARKRY